MDYIDYILPVYFDKAEEPDIQGNGFFIQYSVNSYVID